MARRRPRPGGRPAALLIVSEQVILRIAASLADPGIAVNLRENLGNLDARNIALVTDAIAAANGGRAAAPARKATR